MRKYLILAFILLAPQAIAGGPTNVDGVVVDGETGAMLPADLQSAITEIRRNVHELKALEVVNKDVIHAFLEPRDLGWLAVTREKYGWSVIDLALPQDSKILDCIQDAQQVYVFPNTNPKYPRRDEKHLRLLGAEGRSELVGLIGAKDDWWQGLYEIGTPDKPDTDVGFVFKTEKCELVLFFLDDSLVDGTFDGESLKGLLNPDVSRKLTAWAAKYAPAELSVPSEEPPTWTRMTSAPSKMVNGMMVDGDLDHVSDSDIQQAFAAFKDAGSSSPMHVEVMSKDEIRGYVTDSSEMTATRIDCASAGSSEHSCWRVAPNQLPGYADVMRHMRDAKYVHVSPVASPLKHYPDYDHRSMLGDAARNDLTELLGSQDSWLVGADSGRPQAGKLPADLSVEFIDGKDQVDMFFSADGRVEGDFNLGYFSGTLSPTAAQALQAWKAKYAQPEF